MSSINTFQTLAHARRAMAQKGYNISYLIGRNHAAKTEGSTTKGYVVGMLYLEPSAKLCPYSKIAGCMESCLKSAGRMHMSSAQKARAERTRMLENDPDLFRAVLVAEITALVHYAERKGMKPAVRLNGTSDINWAKFFPELFNWFSYSVQFYDYTKSPQYLKDAQRVPNLHVSASYSAANPNYADRITKAAEDFGANLVVVFSGKLPQSFHGKPVVDGDEYDMRFLDPNGVVVGLKAKGEAKYDRSGFVVHSSENMIAMG